MYANSQSIYNCTYAPDAFQCPAGQKLTYNAATKKLYVHLFDYPAAGTLTLQGYKGRVKYAQFLHDRSELLLSEEGNDIVLKLPVKKPGFEIPVVEMILN
jgi:alpha-L-fucosidase